MKRIVAIAVAAIAVAGSAQAQSHYDWRSGNSYNVQRNFDGSTTVRGYNIQNGTNWNITQQQNGRYNGWTSKGGYFNGDHNTGYHNGNGRTCFGKGYARTCN